MVSNSTPFLSDDKMRKEKQTNTANQPCDKCGRARSRHTVAEAKECQKALKDGVTPITKVSNLDSKYMQTKFKAYNDSNQGWKR